MSDLDTYFLSFFGHLIAVEQKTNAAEVIPMPLLAIVWQKLGHEWLKLNWDTALDLNHKKMGI